MSQFGEYERYDAVGLAEIVRAGQVSPYELVEAAIAQIESHDARYNAVVHRMFDEARTAARGPIPDGPLRGVPYLLKDLHATFGGHPTSNGSASCRGRVADTDSTLVARLKAAGLLVVGKTNTPELGIMGITEPRAFGPSRNPNAPDYTPGGSSGGSGAAVAARYVPAAHASDGGGSIRIPASHCGLVGLKPSRGRVPPGPDRGYGWGGLATEHALTRSVRDCAALLDISAGSEPGEAYQVHPPQRPYAEEVTRDPGRLRIAFSTRAVLAGQTHPDCVTAVDQAARIASGLGHDVEEAEPDLDVEVLRRAYFAFVASGVAADLEEIGRGRGSVVRPADVEPTTWVFNQIGGALRGVDVESARRASAKLGFDLARFFSRYDVWLTPTCARPPARVGELYPDASKERLMGLLRVVGTRSVLLRALDKLAAEAIAATPNTQIANLAGVPAISLPLHVNADGLPIGTQWVAPLGREDVLLRLSAQLEGSFILGRRV